MKNQIIGIVDEPNPRGNEDTLDIFRHATALTEFIKHTMTPMTIGIQGEWGSGKTSLLNSIYHALENESKYKQIWVNSWEHSLLTTPEEALLKIMNEIIQEMLSSDNKIAQQDKIKKVASNVFRGALRISATAVGGSKAGEVAEELLGKNTNSIKELREQLDILAKEIQKSPSNQFEKIVIYVDDLDRIEPKNAVQILELLKNIFSIPNCVFVLAIDYQVVVKGLEHKFGKRTEENEWEFRAFFDKIIQLPFMMPMGQYNIGKYVGDLLKQIGFVDDENQFIDEIDKVISYTIGGNPRSLKRLINSLALINIFSKIDPDSEGNVLDNNDEKMDKDEIKDRLLFSLVCLQISYPVIYDLLTENPDFLSWNEDLAFEITQKKEEGREEQEKEKFNKDFEIAQKTKFFDEKWEKALYRICYSKPRYKSRVKDISQFFNYLKDELLKKYKKDKLKNIIAEVINDTAVTSVSATDESQKRTAPKTEYRESMVMFWEQWILAVKDIPDFHKMKFPPQRQHTVVSQLKIGRVVVFLSKKVSRVEIYIDTGDKDVNKKYFDELFSEKNAIESEIDYELHWDRLSDKRACRISINNKQLLITNEDDWPKIIDYFIDGATKMKEVFKERINRIAADQTK